MEHYKSSLKELFIELGTTEKGLSTNEAKDRLQKYGYNRIEEKKKESLLAMFLSQFNDPVVWVLIGALVISTVTGYIEYSEGNGSFLENAADPIVIGAIVIINAIIGFKQEYKAEKAIEALTKLVSQKAVVLRDGKDTELNAAELVPGDIIILTAGAKIPADSRLITLNSLQVQEAVLTGESVPVKKEITVYNKDLQLGDQKNMVFSGTIITDGKARALVVRTGMQTEIGKIAKMIETADERETPLQQKLDKLGGFLTKVTLAICVVVFAVIFLKAESLHIQENVIETLINSLIVSVSLAVAAIPEGLPAVVTISLAFGVQMMVRKNALIRKLPSVETLGGTTVICSDKTGTLTKNEMTVRKIFVDNKIIDVSGSGYAPVGEFSQKAHDLELLLKIGVLNNDAHLEKTDEGYKIMGDPTEGALIVTAAKGKLDYEKLVKTNERLDEILFDSIKKRMTTIHKIDGKKYAYVKGAPDIVLNLCSSIIIDGKVKKLTTADKTKILKGNEEFSQQALRVLGFAFKELKGKETKNYETNLTFVGLQGMIDPPREEVKEAIAKCKSAGIKVVMITGDYIGTAMAIAKELGIEGKAVVGEELESTDMEKEVENIGIYARVNPEHKMAIVNALKKKGHIVAMTGDGVNDAPAIKSADIGIAMGIAGTDVAKEASDMILLDDNFASIVNAVEEGRGIYDNIKKFVQYLLSCNLGEVLVIFVSTLIFADLPLLAVQILWMNLVTDGLPAVALGVDPVAKDIMTRKPRNTRDSILTKAFLVRVFYTGVLVAIATLFVFWYSKDIQNVGLAHARTLAFTTLVVLEFVRLHIIRKEYKIGILSNKSLLGAVLLSLFLQFAIIYLPIFLPPEWNLFKTTVLGFMDWLFILGVSAAMLAISTIINKIFQRTRTLSGD